MMTSSFLNSLYTDTFISFSLPDCDSLPCCYHCFYFRLLLLASLSTTKILRTFLEYNFIFIVVQYSCVVCNPDKYVACTYIQRF